MPCRVSPFWVELALDGTISAVTGVLPAAMAANMRGHGLICPAACGPAAAWASSDLEVLAPVNLIQLANHMRGTQIMARPVGSIAKTPPSRATSRART